MTDSRTGRPTRIQAVYSQGEDILGALSEPTEADTQDHLIEPILEALGYPRSHMRRQVGDGRNIPDRIVWPIPVVDAEKDNVPARFIIEEKLLGTEFDKPRSNRADTPSRQIQRYLHQHRLADDQTLGILTDGRTWRIYERYTDSETGSTSVTLAAEYMLQFKSSDNDLSHRPIFSLDHYHGADNLVELLAIDQFRRKPASFTLFPFARKFLNNVVAAIRNNQVASVIEAFTDQRINKLHIQLPDSGIIADAYHHDWDSNFLISSGPTYLPNIKQPNPPLLPPNIRLAAIPFRSESYVGKGEQLRKGDIALCARAFGKTEEALLACCYTTSQSLGDNSFDIRMRLVLHVNGRTLMTSEFNPDLPYISIMSTLDKVIEWFHLSESKRKLDKLQAAFDILPLQREFYVKVESWLKSQLGSDTQTTYNMAMVRHLIRLLFAWILKEHGLIPRSLFDVDFINLARRDTASYEFGYHEDILSYLFHNILNTSYSQRTSHPIADLDSLFQITPFLNGSIFARHHSDDLISLPDNAYWADDSNTPGLFNILESFQWTLDEHSAQTHDQALDPELLGALFERLVCLIDHTKPPPRRKPKGTYYTPRDVVEVMVSDALVARLQMEDDLNMPEIDLRLLFSENDDSTPSWPVEMRKAVSERLRRLTFFDPAVGSGVFLLGTLDVLLRALNKLKSPDLINQRRGDLVRAIIREQLHGSDVQPLAAQIARLRLFLAIEATEGAQTSPLPNLEARIVTANAYGTVPDPGWTPLVADQLTEVEPEFRQLLDNIIATRRQWFDAHDNELKQSLRDTDRALRAKFAAYVHNMPVSRQYQSFVDWSPLEQDESIADSDPRLIFGYHDWTGFDVIIGNPPYGNLTKDVKEQLNQRNYQALSTGRSEGLFVELALTLAHPQKGIVELVLPLGVSFRQDHAKLRAQAQGLSSLVDLHHYDMTPGRIFNTEPTAKDWPNKQRILLLTARRGVGGRVRTSGLRRWFEEPRRNERAACLSNRRLIEAVTIPAAATDGRIAFQWLRTPTKASQALVVSLLRQSKCVGDIISKFQQGTHAIGLPHTAYQYISALPAGAIFPRRENVLQFRTERDFRITLVALNAHVFYGWWLMTGDGFDVNVHTATLLGLPESWVCEGREQRAVFELADQLIEALPYCITGKRNAGVQWKNVDFFSGAPALIEQIDRLQIRSLGLPFEPLMRDLHAMRSGSSWNMP